MRRLTWAASTIRFFFSLCIFALVTIFSQALAQSPPDVTAAISIGGQPIAITTTLSNQNASLTFNGNAGQRINFVASGSTFGSCFTLSILKPDASAWLAPHTKCGSSFSTDVQELPASGTYTIVLNPSGTGTGSVSLTLYEVLPDPSAEITAGGPFVVATTTVPGQNASLTFHGNAGQRINFVASGSTFGSCITLSILKPDASALLAPHTKCGSTFSTDVQELPASGTYTIVLNPSGTATGSATLNLYDVLPDPNTEITIDGPSVVVTTTVPGQNSSMTFSGNAGQRVNLVTAFGNTYSGCVRVSIWNPDGTALIPENLHCGGFNTDVQVLPASGTYTIRINPHDLATGSITFRLYEVLPDVGTEITIGGPSVVVTTTVPGQNASITFSGNAGQRVNLVAAFGNTYSGCLYVSMWSPDGTALVPVHLECGGFNTDVQVLPASGNYAIRINHYALGTGSITFRLYDVPPDVSAGIAIGGEAVTVTTSVPGQNASLTFSANAGQLVNLAASGSTYGCLWMSIWNPDGTALVPGHYECGSSFATDVLSLTASGNYTVRMNPNGVTTGTVVFKLHNLLPDVSGAITIGGAAVTVTTTLPGQDASITFSGNAGQRINLTASGSTYSGCLRLSILNPDTTELLPAGPRCGSAFSSDVLTLPASGTYTIRSDPDGIATGSTTYVLFEVLPDVNAPIAVGGDPVTITTTVPGQNANLIFSGSAGQRISLAASASTYSPCIWLSILNPDGAVLMNPALQCGTAYNSGMLILPATGNYRIVLNPDGIGTGSATLTLALVPTPPTAEFALSIANGEAPLDVQFQNLTTGTVSAYAWNFGDGRTSTEANPTLRFSTAGTFAVVLRASNTAGYTEASNVVVVSADITKPVLGPASIDGIAVGATLTLQQTKQLRLTVTDAAGLRAVSAMLAGLSVPVVNVGGDTFQLALDPLAYANGDHTLQLSAEDTAGNIANTQLAVQINLSAPAAPTLTAPAANFKTNQALLTVSGATPLGAEAQLLLNGIAHGPWFAVANQLFSSPLTLAEGINQVAVQVRNSRGQSPASGAVQVTLDTSKPGGPLGLTALLQAQGKVRLNWTPATDQASLGSVILRAAAPFDTAPQAVRINASPLAERSFDDLPPADGAYYYRVASINQLGSLSTLSNSVMVRADSTLPKANAIVYAPAGKFDPVSGRIGQGVVNLTVTVSEPMLASVFLSIVPQGGVPIPVELTASGELTYSGRFLVDANTPSGTAHALFSARDAAGNRGTDIGAGATLSIDTAGPEMSAIILNPVSPIQNDSARTVQATFSFSKAPAAVPVVKYKLSGPLRTPVALGTLNPINASTYQGSFTLPADAGLASAELLSFSFVAQDDLMNLSTRVSAVNRFQVYQGALPPVNVPFGLIAKAQPGGRVALSWQAVDDATSYQLYRQAPGQGALQPLQRAGGTDYLDQTAQDGAYRYAVSAVRQANGQESESGQGAAVDVIASATAPGAPQNLALQLSGRGIYSSWQPPLASTVDSYNLYRAGGTSIVTIGGLTPLKTGIKTLFTYDTNPQPSTGAYVVTAVDAAGNESAMSNSSYLNASLLPVRNLQVEQIGNELPVLTWMAPNGNLVNYLAYVGPESGKIKLTPSPIVATTLVDTGYTGGERRYTVASVDGNGIEMARSVLLPNLATQIASGLPLLRGVMNRVQVQVANMSASALEGVRVVVRLPVNAESSEFKDHKSAVFSLAANQTMLVPVVVAGYAGLPAAPLALVGVEIAPSEGELVKISRAQTVAVSEGALVVGMATDAFTRGGVGKLKLTIENTSEVDVELLVASNNGMAPSPELRFKLLDADDNVLATQPFIQPSGANIVTLSNGLTVARIAAGANYVSDEFTVNVPSASPNGVRLKLEVDKLRYHSGQDDELLIGGRGSEKAISLLDTAYTGEVTAVAPLSSYGDQDVLISGRALDRAGSVPLPNTRVKLILNQQGFERTFSVLTDGSGNFAYSFKPTLTDAGLFKVSAVHPDITDRPEQKAFSIHRVTVGPTPYQLDVPRNYPFAIPLVAKAGPGTTATRVRFTLDAASQPTGQLPLGVTLQMPAPVSLAERQSLNVPVQFSADNDAQLSGSVILNVVSDENGGAPLGRVRVEYKLSEAKPYLVSTPAYIETGLAQGASLVESFTLKNQGMQEALNLKFALTKVDGGAVPGWIAIGSQASGTLAIGASRAIDLSFTPPPGTPEGLYEFKLNVTGDNLSPQALNVYVSLSQSGKGNLLFKASDIYTATMDKNGALIAGLANASVLVQNEDVPTITHELTTDALGEALFHELPAGRYQFRAKAPNHQETRGRLVVKPGITINQPIFLNYNLITVEWSVREITIEDRYEINLNATFETDVPGAVVLLEPSSVNLPKMQAGDVYYGELSLTNYGLIRADHVKQLLPVGDGSFRFEFLATPPAVLDAKQRVTLPYRVIALQAPDGGASAANASGGGTGCGPSYSTVVSCDFECANGMTSGCGSSTMWIYGTGNLGSCGAFFGGPAGAIGWGGSTPIKIKSKKCQYIPKGGTKCD